VSCGSLQNVQTSVSSLACLFGYFPFLGQYSVPHWELAVSAHPPSPLSPPPMFCMIPLLCTGPHHSCDLTDGLPRNCGLVLHSAVTYPTNIYLSICQSGWLKCQKPLLLYNISSLPSQACCSLKENTR